MESDQREYVLGAEQRFGAKVRALREAAQMSQEQVASVLSRHYGLNWHQTTAHKTEAAQRPIRLIEAAALAELFGCPLGDLVDPVGTVDWAVRLIAQRQAALREISLLSAHLQRREVELRHGIDDG